MAWGGRRPPSPSTRCPCTCPQGQVLPEEKSNKEAASGLELLSQSRQPPTGQDQMHLQKPLSGSIARQSSPGRQPLGPSHQCQNLLAPPQQTGRGGLRGGLQDCSQGPLRPPEAPPHQGTGDRGHNPRPGAGLRGQARGPRRWQGSMGQRFPKDESSAAQKASVWGQPGAGQPTQSPCRGQPVLCRTCQHLSA